MTTTAYHPDHQYSPELRETAARLSAEPGVAAILDMDARNLDAALPGQTFDTIVFQFPAPRWFPTCDR